MTITFPKENAQLNPADANPDILEFLARRRSGKAKNMTAPGPNADELALILKLAARVPDHRKLAPWRFILFEGDARTQFGEALARVFTRNNPDMPSERAAHEKERFLRAPVVVGVVSSPKVCPRGTPKWEQELSAGAACFNLLLAARASGYSAQWLSEWYAFDSEIAQILGLSSSERMAGFIYIGSTSEPEIERKRPDMRMIVSHWSQ